MKRYEKVHAGAVGLKGTELPEEINGRKEVCDLLEKIRGTACVMMGLARDLQDARENSPGAPKVGVVTPPQSFVDIAGHPVDEGEMDVCARVLSVFKCHKASPLTAACAISVAAALEGSVVAKVLRPMEKVEYVRIGHPSGIMTMCPELAEKDGKLELPGVGAQRTARRIMEGTVFIRN